MTNSGNTLEKIKQRRSQMLVHSFLYYVLDNPIISDTQFDKWAKELVELHDGDVFINWYDDEFVDWDGSTGHHLHFDEQIMNKAYQLLRYKEKLNNS